MFGLFMYSRYYPRGGTNDLIGTYYSIDEALAAARESRDCHDHYEIVNSRFETEAWGSTNEL